MTSDENLNGMIPAEDGDYLRPGPQVEKVNPQSHERFSHYLGHASSEALREEIELSIKDMEKDLDRLTPEE